MNETYSIDEEKLFPKQLLKFKEFSKPKINQSIFDEISKKSFDNTQSDFNQLHSKDFDKLNTEDLRNRSLRSSQGGRWLRSQSYMHEQ